MPFRYVPRPAFPGGGVPAGTRQRHRRPSSFPQRHMLPRQCRRDRDPRRRAADAPRVARHHRHHPRRLRGNHPRQRAGLSVQLARRVHLRGRSPGQGQHAPLHTAQALQLPHHGDQRNPGLRAGPGVYLSPQQHSYRCRRLHPKSDSGANRRLHPHPDPRTDGRPCRLPVCSVTAIRGGLGHRAAAAGPGGHPAVPLGSVYRGHRLGGRGLPSGILWRRPVGLWRGGWQQILHQGLGRRAVEHLRPRHGYLPGRQLDRETHSQQPDDPTPNLTQTPVRGSPGRS
mmetsp:Transcript_33938/g.96162  ORF Transcript_33938/g.96162 Transcript_33938/m.96162 type:complete len:284 (+) Transcript_33938:106-957(+)